jgi:hypothetical protein
VLLSCALPQRAAPRSRPPAPPDTYEVGAILLPPIVANPRVNRDHSGIAIVWSHKYFGPLRSGHTESGMNAKKGTIRRPPTERTMARVLTCARALPPASQATVGGLALSGRNDHGSRSSTFGDPLVEIRFESGHHS